MPIAKRSSAQAGWKIVCDPMVLKRRHGGAVWQLTMERPWLNSCH